MAHGPRPRHPLVLLMMLAPGAGTTKACCPAHPLLLLLLLLFVVEASAPRDHPCWRQLLPLLLHQVQRVTAAAAAAGCPPAPAPVTPAGDAGVTLRCWTGPAHQVPTMANEVAGVGAHGFACFGTYLAVTAGIGKWCGGRGERTAKQQATVQHRPFWPQHPHCPPTAVRFHCVLHIHVHGMLDIPCVLACSVYVCMGPVGHSLHSRHPGAWWVLRPAQDMVTGVTRPGAAGHHSPPAAAPPAAATWQHRAQEGAPSAAPRWAGRQSPGCLAGTPGCQEDLGPLAAHRHPPPAAAAAGQLQEAPRLATCCCCCQRPAGWGCQASLVSPGG